MIITHHGASCLKISAKTQDGKDVVLVANPFDSKKIGIKLPRIKADVVLISDSSDPIYNNFKSINSNGDRSPVIIDEPGEYEIEGMAIHGVKDAEDESIVYRVEIERIVVGLIGSMKNSSGLSDAQTEVLQNTDILALPIGGSVVMDMKQARDVVNQLQPRVVIPIFYKVPNIKIDGISGNPSEFIQKELGIKSDEVSDKFKITHASLPQDEMKGVLLSI